MVRNLYMSPDAFTIENNGLTPTQKIKRYIAAKKFEEEIKKLYAEPIPDIKPKA